jgi:predicted membrane-bound spermidine synthase
MQKQPNMQIIFAIILLEGLVSISVEILAIRQITPFVGSNIINTSVVIGSFLLFLALGYRKGGQINENHFMILNKNLLLSQLFITLGLSYMFLSTLYDITSNTYLFILIFSLFVVGSIVYLLGQTIPILSNFFKDKSIGEISGMVLFLSTFGSFLGSVGTATIAINFIGVNNTIILISFIVFLVNILIFSYSRKFLYLFLSFALLGVSVVANPKIFIVSNNYSDISIEKNIKKDEVVFVVNRSGSSSLENNRTQSSFWYIKQLEAYIGLGTANNKEGVDILVAGAGGFTLGVNDKKNRYTFIDIDKDLKTTAEKYFLEKKINGEFVVSSIRNYLKTSTKKFKYIILDTYSNEMTIPPFHTTQEYMLEIKERLTKDGEALFNIICKSNFSTKYARNINNTINSVYNCTVLPNIYSSDLKVNMLYFCKPKWNTKIHTDNFMNLFDFK